MIPAVRRPDKHLSPRFQLFGKPAPWFPRSSGAVRVDPADTTLGVPRSVDVPTFQPFEAARIEVDGLVTATAQSMQIGWFADQAPGAAGRLSSPGDTGGPVLGIRQPVNGAGRKDDLIERLAALLQPPLQLLLGTEGVLEWPAALLPFQRDGVATLLARKEVLLADDMGLGKTIQAIAALRILYFRDEIENALIVCPAALVNQWQREIARWAPELTVITITGAAPERGVVWRLRAHVKLISYDTLRGDVLDLMDSPALRSKWSVVVLDEASRIKNADTGISIACKRLPRDRRWALTGTPLENRIDDVGSILEFLLNNSDNAELGAYHPARLREQLKQVQLRRKKQDVLPDLPPKQVVEQLVDLRPRQREAYDLAERAGIVRLKEAGYTVTVTHVLELIMRLKQICNNDPASGESAKADNITERLGTIVDEGHRALVFSQFTDQDFGVQMMAKRLDKFSPLVYTGAMSGQQKGNSVDVFLADPSHKALILSLRAGGVGLNLQAASYVFHLDRWWNPAIEDQAEGRSHRMGQPFPVTAFRYICSGTIEERIAAKLLAKRELFRDVVDDISLDLSAALNEEELFGLFDLQPSREMQLAAAPVPFSAMTGVEFEEWLAAQLREAGFTVETTPVSRDGGVDLIASKQDELQIESRLIIQCKNSREPVGVAVVRELRGVLPDRSAGTTAVVACPGGFTADAFSFARSSGVLLWGNNELLKLSSNR